SGMAKDCLHIGLVTSAYPPTIDGYATYIHDAAVSLVRCGHTVTVVVLDSEHGPVTDQVVVSPEGVTVVWIGVRTKRTDRLSRWLTGLAQPAWSLTVYRALRRRHKRMPFDVIEFMNWNALGVVHSLWKLAPQVMRLTTSIGQVVRFSIDDATGAR